MQSRFFPLTMPILKNGLLSLPGRSFQARTLADKLLARDAEQHHFLGASPGLLQKIYDVEKTIQRPIVLEETDKNIVVTEENWTKNLGNPSAYHAFVSFFKARVQQNGISTSLEVYLFGPAANLDGVNMLVRLMSGALHPFIQIGYGLEFGNEALVWTGLAQTAVHQPLPPNLFNSGQTRQPSRGISLLEILHKFDATPAVMPYDPDALISARVKSALSGGRTEEIVRLCSLWDIDESLGDAELNSRVEECIFASTLLLFATGKEGKAPRLDFFLMHLVTSALFLKSYFPYLRNTNDKANLLRAFVPNVLLMKMARGQPIIKPDLLMNSNLTPRPPYNPWPALLESVLYAPDPHVKKTLRTLLYADVEYGTTAPGTVIGAFLKDDPSKETFPGAAKLDGTIFVRAAGMMEKYFGWYTQKVREDWDRSALGWDAAWDEDK
ncbi:hypothetical protein C8J56DRAFT_1099801 [Mycena floridula]|nr:hypothetical protein C8J56DRAFT_1099801 [Mycena floridula]